MLNPPTVPRTSSGKPLRNSGIVAPYDRSPIGEVEDALIARIEEKRPDTRYRVHLRPGLAPVVADRQTRASCDDEFRRITPDGEVGRIFIRERMPRSPAVGRFAQRSPLDADVQRLRVRRMNHDPPHGGRIRKMRDPFPMPSEIVAPVECRRFGSGP